MGKEKTRNISVLDNGLVVTWYDDSLPSLETIEETTAVVELQDYLDVLLSRNRARVVELQDYLDVLLIRNLDKKK